MLSDHDLLERARVELAPVSDLAAELVRRFAEDVAEADADAAVFDQPAPLSVDTSPRPTA